MFTHDKVSDHPSITLEGKVNQVVAYNAMHTAAEREREREREREGKGEREGKESAREKERER